MILSVFPSLLSWQQLSPFLIRLTLGGIFLFWSYRTFFKSSPTLNQKIIAIIEAIAGILMVLGVWTQIGALIALVDLIVRLYSKVKSKSFLTDGVNYYFILLVLALSLLITGAGLFAFDVAI